jgi:tetratricopeptide (TPR) repeat protein
VEPGDVISHYRLLERIGRDHDTTIYRARDLTLERDVAVKLLAPDRAATAATSERFRREARIASLVSHPHICAVHDSGEENGQPFIVCELLEGHALDEMLNGPLPPERVLDIAIQLLDGISAVHRRGIVHGNIKPSNVFVTDEGHVKLLELGLMSAWWETEGRPDVDSSSPTASVERRPPADEDVEGFHPYRSPEHLAGERLDQRSDIFSIGAVLYEMATGERAFPGDTPSRIAAAIVSGTPPPAGRRNAALSAIEPILHKALEKAPEDRYQTAQEMLTDLRRTRRRLETSGSGALQARRPRGGARLAAAVLGVALLGTAAWWWWWPLRTGAPVERHAILVGSIANGTNDPDFDGTLRQALTIHLAQSPFLEIVSDERVRQILQMMGRSTDTPLTHATAREACERLQAGALIEGSVSAVGRATVVALVASDCGTGDTIARNQVEVEHKEEVLEAVGRIASTMRRSLGESVRSLEQHNVPIQEATTPSLEALKAFTAGVEKRASGSEIEAIPLLEHAIELDRNFALAYTTLSSVYGGLGESDRAEEYARLAYEHRGSVTERERVFIAYQYHDRVTGDQLKAREALEVWKQSYPLDYRPANALALLLSRLGDYDRAIVEAQEAIKLNPAHPFPYSNLAYAYRGAGRYADARAAAERAVSLGIETVPTRRLLYQIAELEGDAAAAQRHLQWARTRPRGFDLIGAQAQVAAFHGRMAEARDLYQQTIDQAGLGQLSQIAAGYSAQLALTDALFGYPSAAAARARALPAESTYEPQLRAATTLALAGAAADAERRIARLRDLRPSDTLLHTAYLPVAEAALLIARGQTDAAIGALRPSAQYDRGLVAALLPIYLRAEARRRGGAYQEAAQEFRAVLANRGADPFSPAVPLAHLGLGRTLAAAGDVEGSRRAYGDLLAIWQDADPDFPVLQEARRELAALPGAKPPAPVTSPSH